MPTVCQVVGPSGSGKTLALAAAVRRLRQRGLRVAVLKHSHHSLEVRGKDTDRFRRSGADVVVFGGKETVLFSDWDPRQVAQLLPVDVVLVEGFHGRRFPGARLAIRDPREASSLAERIDRIVGHAAPAPRLLGDRRRALSGPWWELVGNVLRSARVRRVDLQDEGRAPRRRGGRRRPAAAANPPPRAVR